MEYKIGIQNFYWNNLKKKAITLFLPYVIWNLLYLFIIWAKVSISQQLGLSVYDYELSILPQNIIGIGEHLINPINYPLWYVRDLICMNIIAFILLFVIRKLGWMGVAILSVLYISNIEISIPGFSSTAIFFVTAGTYMGYHRISILNTFKRVKLEAIIGFIILIILALYYNQSNYSQYLIRLYIPLGVINVFNLASYISNNFPRVTNISIKLSPIVFFIYVTHTMYLINWVIGGLNSLGYNEGLSKLIPYLLTPTITISISLIGFIILNRFSPKLLAISMGGR